MPFARLARRPRLGAFLCAIAALLSINGCHSVPVARSTEPVTAIAVTEQPSAAPGLARGQNGNWDTISQPRRRPERDASDDAASPWGHVGANDVRRTPQAVSRGGNSDPEPRPNPSRSAVLANRPGRFPETEECETRDAADARRRLDLMPAPSGRMALTDFSDPIHDQPEPDWIEPAPSHTQVNQSDFDVPVPCSTINWRDDARGLFPMLWDDTRSLVNWRSAIALGAAAGGAIAIRENLDGRVRDHIARNPLKWGEASEVLRQFGEFQYQLPVIAGVYGLSLWTEDDHLHEFSLSLISAYTLSSVATVSIKAITNTQRPTDVYQDGEYGFPSFHTSSTFSMAAVIDEYYGWKAGVPAYVLAGLVGWSRIDQQEHDLSDVVFGAALGFVVGKTVSAAHIERHTHMQVTPYYDPAQQTGGVMFEKRY